LAMIGLGRTSRVRCRDLPSRLEFMVCWGADTDLPPNQRAAGRALWFVAKQIKAALSPAPDDPLTGDARLVVSELVTNAVNAGTTTLRLELQLHRSTLDLAVTDNAAGAPTIAPDRVRLDRRRAGRG
jgi:anti-sigma regulatory factor (Ser/Thr protein kinase)